MFWNNWRILAVTKRGGHLTEANEDGTFRIFRFFRDRSNRKARIMESLKRSGSRNALRGTDDRGYEITPSGQVVVHVDSVLRSPKVKRLATLARKIVDSTKETTESSASSG